MKLKAVAGIILVFIGIGLFIINDYYIKPEREAKELMTEAKMIFERGDKNAINQSINIFTKIIAKYPESKVIPESYLFIAKCYEKLGLNRLAYLKYNYLLKNNMQNLSKRFKKEILMRLARLNILKKYSEEGVNQLYDLLNNTFNKEFRSRVYSELGHTYLKLKEYKKAERMFDIALNEFGSNEDAILGKARATKRMGQDNKAYNLYDHFLKYYGAVSQYSTDVRKSYKEQAYRSGLNAYRRGQHWNAISFFNRILKSFPYDKKVENSLYWIGESYFSLGKFSKAISFFNRVLKNSFYHKDQDAQIKKGYAFFSSKKFDLAAREFQKYLREYPKGKYASIAKEWKKMSTKEILHRIENQKTYRTDEDLSSEEEEDKEEKYESLEEKDEEVSGYINNKPINIQKSEKIMLENVAEL